MGSDDTLGKGHPITFLACLAIYLLSFILISLVLLLV